MKAWNTVEIEIAAVNPVRNDEVPSDSESSIPREIVENYDFSIYEEGETKYRPAPKLGGNQHMGCFGIIFMYFVHKNQEKARKNHKSLISRNKQFKKEIGKSVRFRGRTFLNMY